MTLHLINCNADIRDAAEAQEAHVDDLAGADAAAVVVVDIGLPSPVERVVVGGAGEVDRHAVVGVGRLRRNLDGF